MPRKLRKIVKRLGNQLLDAAGRVVLGPEDPDYDEELKKLIEREKKEKGNDEQ